MTIPPPDVSSRPFRLTVQVQLATSPHRLFQGWTERLDQWLAAPGTVIMRPEPNTAFYFETHHRTERHPYYGRFIRLIPGALIEMVWLSTGTQRAETILTLEFTATDQGSSVQLTHSGLPDEQTRLEHEQVWPLILQELDRHCTASGG